MNRNNNPFSSPILIDVSPSMAAVATSPAAAATTTNNNAATGTTLSGQKRNRSTMLSAASSSPPQQRWATTTTQPTPPAAAAAAAAAATASAPAAVVDLCNSDNEREHVICVDDDEDDRKMPARKKPRSTSKTTSASLHHMMLDSSAQQQPSNNTDGDDDRALAVKLQRQFQQEAGVQVLLDVDSDNTKDDEQFALNLQSQFQQEQQKVKATNSAATQEDQRLAQELDRQFRQEEEARKQAEYNQMHTTIPGRAFAMVQDLLQWLKNKQKAFPKAKEFTAVSEDAMVPMAEAFLGKLEEFKKAGRPVDVDIGVHYTKQSSLNSIKDNGLLTRDDQATTRCSGASHSGQAYGPGVYTANDPISSQTYGEVGLLVARLFGSTTENRSSRTHDTILVPHVGWVVLRESAQCIPLIQFQRDTCAQDSESTKALMRVLQNEFVDVKLNGGKLTNVSKKFDTVANVGPGGLPFGPGFGPSVPVMRSAPFAFGASSSAAAAPSFGGPSSSASAPATGAFSFGGSSSSAPAAPVPPPTFGRVSRRRSPRHSRVAAPPVLGGSSSSSSTTTGAAAPTPQPFSFGGSSSASATPVPSFGGSQQQLPRRSQPRTSPSFSFGGSSPSSSTGAAPAPGPQPFSFGGTSSTAAAPAPPSSGRQSPRRSRSRTASSVSFGGTPASTSSVAGPSASSSFSFGAAMPAPSNPFGAASSHPARVQNAAGTETIQYTAPQSLSVDTGSAYTKQALPSKDQCSICLMDMYPGEHVASLKCGHNFHEDCVKQSLQHSQKCPNCNQFAGSPVGKMPSGTMRVSLDPLLHCQGFPAGTGTFVIQYNIPSGMQMQYHDNPGVPHGGAHRAAYLPNTAEGQNILKRLKFAFRNGLTFTVGTSMTSGATNQVTWSSIHHKTHVSGGQAAHGFPDDNYFGNVNAELDSAGVPAARDL